MNFLSPKFIIEIIKKPKLKMYWSDHPVCGTPIPPPPKKKKTLPCMLCSDTSFMRKRFLQLQSPTSTSSSASLPETSGVTSWVAANDLPYRLNEKREEHVLLHFPLSKTDKTCTRKYRVCLKTNSVPLDGFVKSLGSHCSHDCTAQDITH